MTLLLVADAVWFDDADADSRDDVNAEAGALGRQLQLPLGPSMDGRVTSLTVLRAARLAWEEDAEACPPRAFRPAASGARWQMRRSARLLEEYDQTPV
jgi:hypothetical protein